VWTYGEEGNSSDLRYCLEPYRPDRLRVVDEHTERVLKQVRTVFERETDTAGHNCLHLTALRNGDGDVSARLLLEIGMNPGLADMFGKTALHFCARYARTLDPETVAILWMCRPPLDAVELSGKTPLQVAQQVTPFLQFMFWTLARLKMAGRASLSTYFLNIFEETIRYAYLIGYREREREREKLMKDVECLGELV
jgi:hypothetical protein